MMEENRGGLTGADLYEPRWCHGTTRIFGKKKRKKRSATDPVAITLEYIRKMGDDWEELYIGYDRLYSILEDKVSGEAEIEVVVLVNGDFMEENDSNSAHLVLAEKSPYVCIPACISGQGKKAAMDRRAGDVVRWLGNEVLALMEENFQPLVLHPKAKMAGTGTSSARTYASSITIRRITLFLLYGLACYVKLVSIAIVQSIYKKVKIVQALL